MSSAELTIEKYPSRRRSVFIINFVAAFPIRPFGFPSSFRSCSLPVYPFISYLLYGSCYDTNEGKRRLQHHGRQRIITVFVQGAHAIISNGDNFIYLVIFTRRTWLIFRTWRVYQQSDWNPFCYTVSFRAFSCLNDKYKQYNSPSLYTAMQYIYTI